MSPDSPDSSCRPAGFKPPARRTHALELGLGFQGDKSTDAYAELARLGEELGFDVLSVYADLFPPPDERRFAQVRAAATITAFAVNVITI